MCRARLVGGVTIIEATGWLESSATNAVAPSILILPYLSEYTSWQEIMKEDSPDLAISMVAAWPRFISPRMRVRSSTRPPIL